MLMTLNLNEKKKDLLKKGLAEVLTKTSLLHNLYIEDRSIQKLQDLEVQMPKSGKTRSDLVSYISETPLFDFVSGYINKELSETQKWDSEKASKLLSSVSSYSSLTDLSNKIIEELDSLPWEYSCIFKVNDYISQYITSEVTEISESIILFKGSSDLAEKLPRESEIPLYDNHFNGADLLGLGGLGGTGMRLEPRTWTSSSLYIQIKVKGFIGRFSKTSPEIQAVESLKSVMGLLLALRVAKVSYSYRAQPLDAKGLLYRNTGTWKMDGVIEVDSQLSKAINDIRIDDLNGSLVTDNQKTNFVIIQLNTLSKALHHDKSSEKVRSAGQWLFESHYGNNELLSFIQAAVSLEILLGDKETSNLMGLGELLRNRCAYLIGNSHEQRDEVLKDFKKIYDIRSKIVHSGKSRLNKDERKLFNKLQWMASRVIQEELKLIGNNS